MMDRSDLTEAQERALAGFARGDELGGTQNARAMRTAAPRTVRRLIELGLVETYTVDGQLGGEPFTFTKRRITDAGRAQAARRLERPAWLHLDGWAGHTRQPVIVVGETPTRYRIRVEQVTRLGGFMRNLHPGERALVPRRAITFPPDRPLAEGWTPWKPSMSSTGICGCSSRPDFQNGVRLACARCVPRVDPPPA